MSYGVPPECDGAPFPEKPIESTQNAPSIAVFAGYDGAKRGRQGKSLAVWPAYMVDMIGFSENCKRGPVSRFGKNINDINARTAIHPSWAGKGPERGGGACRQRTPVKMTGGTRRQMIGYM
jgi:hypothetical protein